MSKKILPIEDGLMTLPATPEESPSLLGTKCNSCGAVFSPRRKICGRCFQESTEDILLSSKGNVRTATVIRVTPPGSKIEAPYALGEVTLPEGLNIRTVFTGVSLEKPLEPGIEMEMVIEKIYEDKEGNDIVGPKFRPVH